MATENITTVRCSCTGCRRARGETNTTTTNLWWCDKWQEKKNEFVFCPHCGKRL
jgi:hypothetical protein